MVRLLGLLFQGQIHAPTPELGLILPLQKIIFNQARRRIRGHVAEPDTFGVDQHIASETVPPDVTALQDMYIAGQAVRLYFLG